MLSPRRGAEVTPKRLWVQLAWSCSRSVKPKEALVGRRGRRRGFQGRAEGRVRGRVRERVQGRPGRRGRGSAGGRRGAIELGDIEGYANRLGDRVGGTSGLSGAASGLAGAASGLAGGSLAHRILGSGAQSSDEDFEREIRERLDAMDDRLTQLEERMSALGQEGGAEEDPGDPSEPGGETDPYNNR